MASPKDVVVKVRYTADLTDMEKQLKSLVNQSFRVGINDKAARESFTKLQIANEKFKQSLSGEITLDSATRGYNEIQKAVESVRKTLGKLQLDTQRTFDSDTNKRNLADLKKYEAQVDSIVKKIKEWNKLKGKGGAIDVFQTQYGISGDKRKRGAEVRELKAEQFEIDSLPIATDANIARLAEIEDRLKRIQQLEDLIAKGETLGTKGDLQTQLKAAKAEMVDQDTITLTQDELHDTIQLYQDLIDKANQIGVSSTEGFNAGRKAIDNYSEELKQATKQTTDVANIFTGTFLGTSLSGLTTKVFQASIRFYRDMDEVLTRTMMVTGMARDEVNKLTDSYSKLAQQLDSTMKDVGAAQLVFYQQGLATREALEMTQASIAISKTGGIEAEEAANRLTAAVRGYQLATTDAMLIADKMSALDANAASSVDELTVAMQKSAAQAKVAGLDLDFYMAALSTMQEVTREAPENIGTAMKSITARLIEIRDLGKVEEDGTTFNNVAKALNSVGIAALDSAGQLRNLQDIFNELGPMWSQLTKNQQAYLATTIAGNRQQSRFLALMENYDRAMDLTTVSQNAAGESARQLRAYNSGLEASFNRLSNAWQVFASRITESSTITAVVRGIASLVEAINSLPKGLIQTITYLKLLNTGMKALSALSGGLGGKITGFLDFSGMGEQFSQLFPMFDTVKKKAADIGKGIAKAAAESVQGLQHLKGGLAETGAAATLAKTSMDGNTEALNRNMLATELDVAADSKSTVSKTATTAATAKESVAIGVNTKAIASETKERMGNDQVALDEIKASIDIANAKLTEARAIRDNTFALLEEQKARTSETEMEAMNRLTAETKKLFENYEAEGFSDIEVAEMQRDHLDKLSKEWVRQQAEAQDALGKTYLALDKQNDAVIKSQKEVNKLTKEYHRLAESVNSAKGKQLTIDDFGVNSSGQPESDIINLPAKDKMLGKVNRSALGAMWSDKNIKNIDKVKGSIKELGKGFNVSTVMGGAMIGMLAKMGTEALGFNESVSSTVGNVAGFAQALSGLGPYGALAGAAIGFFKSALDELFPSTAKIESRLAKINEQMDKNRQSIDDTKNSLAIYNELNSKIGLTAEESEQLRGATEVLVKQLPGAIQGYDAYGNAIINAGLAMDSLAAKELKQAGLAEDKLKQLGELSKASANEQTKGGIWKTLGGIASIVAGSIAVATGVGAPLGVAGIIGGAGALGWGGYDLLTITDKQKDENKRIIEENYSEIKSSIEEVQKKFLATISQSNQKTAEILMDNISNSLIEEARSTGARNIGEVSEDIRKQFERLTAVQWGVVDTTLSGLKVRMEVADVEMSLEDKRDYVEKRIEDTLKQAGFSDREIEIVVDASINIVSSEATDVGSLQRQIEQLLESPDGNWNLANLDRFGQALGKLDQATLASMRSLGLLDKQFASMYVSFESGEQRFGIVDMFRDATGAINDSVGALRTYEMALSEINRINQEREDSGMTGSKTDYLLAGGISQNDIDKFNKKLAEGKEITGKSAAEFTRLSSAYEQSTQQLNYWIGVQEKSNQVMELKVLPTFEELSSAIKESATQYQMLLELGKDLDSTNGNLHLDQLTGLFDLLGSFEEAAMSTVEDFQLWNQAIIDINNNLSIQEGLLHLEEDGLKGIAQLTELATRLKYQKMLADIEEASNALKLQRDMMQAELDSVNMTIESMKAEGKANFDATDTKNRLAKNLSDNLDLLNLQQLHSEEVKLTSMLKLNASYYSQISAMAAAYAKGENVDGNATLKSLTQEFENSINDVKTKVQGNLKELVSDSYEDTLKGLEAYSAQLSTQVGILNGRINDEAKLKSTIVQYLSDGTVDLAKTFGDASKSQDNYNERLERTLTLLEKIAGIQHKIDENTSFMDLYNEYDGKKYAEIMMRNLALAEEQYGVYKQLFEMQQEITNQAAGNLKDSPYGELFTIMENGDIGWANSQMYDKYKNLPSAMKEDVDGLVDSYQKERDALRDTEKELVKYAQTQKEVREEVVKLQLQAEQTILAALQNREKILHEARTKALDDEIKMIQKASDARKKAKEAESDEKDLIKTQDALRRAMLDTSGKNNSQLLQLQQQLEDKQLEIAEKRFDQDLKERQDWLSDTKDAETETYQYRLETMTWYNEEASMLMAANYEEQMAFLMQWHEEYRTSTALAQDELIRQWDTTFTALKTVADMGVTINDLTTGFQRITDQVVSMDIKVQSLAGTWDAATSAVNRYSSAASSAGGYSGGTGGGGGADTIKTPDTPKTESNIPQPAFNTGDVIRSKEAFGLVEAYKKDGDNMVRKDYAIAAPPDGFEVKVGKTHYYNGQWYYEDTNGPQKGFWFKGLQLRKYEQGGMVDYTGPAWVDGTRSNPEAFLSAYQTEQIGALAAALDKNSVESFTSDISIGNVSFNVASMSSTADGKKALDAFVQGANDLMAKRGVGTRLSSNAR